MCMCGGVVEVGLVMGFIAAVVRFFKRRRA